MSFNIIDKLAYANKESENYVSFVDYFNTELTKKKTQELRSIKEDFSVYIKLEEDKTKILEGAEETLKGKLKSIKQCLQNAKKENEIDLEEFNNKLNSCAHELESVMKNVKEAKQEKSELETVKEDILEKQGRKEKELENETKKLSQVQRKNESKKDELRNFKVKQDELLADIEEKSKELKDNLAHLKEENKEAKVIKKKYYDTKLLSRSLVEQLNKLKYQNTLDLQDKELIQTTVKEREVLTAELSQLIIAKLDPNIDNKTVKKLDEIMKELDTIIEYGKNISQHILHLKELKLN